MRDIKEGKSTSAMTQEVLHLSVRFMRSKRGIIAEEANAVPIVLQCCCLASKHHLDAKHWCRLCVSFYISCL